MERALSIEKSSEEGGALLWKAEVVEVGAFNTNSLWGGPFGPRF